MSEQAISELEAAAEIIMAPPNIVSNEQRHAAETIFLNFRKSKSPYALCREILEKSQNQYVMFEAAEVLKEAIIREWSFLLDSDRTSLRQYLMQYITSHEVPHFVRERILQVIAIMVKRASIDDMGRERGIILQEVENLIVNAEPDKKLLGCNIIETLMQEYASTVRSADVGIPWEVHFRAKKQFESTDLKRILRFCVYLLSEVVKTDPPYSEIMIQLTRHLLQITERILTWGFISTILPKRIIGIYESVYESDQTPSLKLGSSWSEIVLNPDFVPLMFQIYWKVRDIDGLSHHSLNCLVQLSTLSGMIMRNDEPRIKYLLDYVVNFFNLISNVNIRSKEVLGISTIAKKLVVFFIHDLTRLPQPLRDTIVDEYSRLACHFCDGAAHEIADPDADKVYSDAFDNMLHACTGLLYELSGVPEEKHQSGSRNIFNKYLQCHLAPPDGTRLPEHGVGHIDEDHEDNDRVKYKEQLQSVGLFGRYVLPHSMPVICKILESRIETLLNYLQAMQHRAMNINQSNMLDNLYEDLHWTILLAGHILCLESDGESPSMSPDVTSYAVREAKRGAFNLEATQKALSSVMDGKTEIPDCLDQCDYTLRVVFNVLRLCSIEDVAVTMKLGHFLSPEVGSTLMWFLKRWGMTFLIVEDDAYRQKCSVIAGCFGKDSECAKKMAGFILNKIAVNIYNFQSEPILSRDTVDLFNLLVSRREKSMFLIKTEAMGKLISLPEQVQPGTFPPDILRGLYKGYAAAGACLTDPQEHHNYYETILNPLKQKFKNLVEQKNFAEIYHREDVQKVFIDLLECFMGIAKGSQLCTVEVLFDFMCQILTELPVFFTFYKDYQVIVQLILDLFGQCAKYMLCYLKPFDSKRFYENSLAIVQAYAKCNANRLSSEMFAEESSCQDLILVLDLLTFILSKDCIDFSPVRHEEVISITGCDVALFGLNFIMPLMTLELLKFPNLSAQYYRLLVLLTDIYPEKIAELPPDMLANLLKTIEIGLTQFGNDIVQSSLDFLQGMSSYISRFQAYDTTFARAFKPFLKLLLELTLSHQINSDMYGSVASSLYTLICCFQEEYQTLVQNLIQAQTDPLIAERLAAAFTNLSSHVELTCDRTHRMRFRDNFDKFISTVHGFLLYK